MDDGRIRRISTYAGPNPRGDRLIQRTEYDYTADSSFEYRPLCPDSPSIWHFFLPINPRESSITTIRPGGARFPTATQRTEFGSWASETLPLNKPREIREYSGGVLYRSTFTDYQPTTAFHDTHRFVEVRNSSGTAVTRTDKLFSQDKLLCEIDRAAGAGAIIASCASATGDQKREHVYGTTDSNPRQNRISTTVTGGDPSPEPSPGVTQTSNFSFQGGYLSSKQYSQFSQGASSWFALDRTYDLPSGLVATARDTGKNELTYSWDSLRRLTGIAPTLPELPTTITYDSVVQTRVRQGTTSDFTESIYQYDDLGRAFKVRRRTSADNYEYQLKDIDLLGHVVRESEWTADGGTPQWTAYDYTAAMDPTFGTQEPIHYPDPLGRVHRVTRPGGETVDTDYEGLATIVTQHGIQGPLNNGVPTVLNPTTTYINDAFGRLVSVLAPAGGAKAEYSYDELDRLTAVVLTDPANPAASQYRTFVFDRLGNLRSSENPESGITNYLAYDARGNLLSFRDGRGREIHQTFDEADRLTAKFDRRGTASLYLEGNAYDACPSESSLACLGKLTMRIGYRVRPGSGSTYQFDEVYRRSFFYGDPTGTSNAPSCDLAGGVRYAGLNGRLATIQTKMLPWTTPVTTSLCQDAFGADAVIGYPWEGSTAIGTRTRGVIEQTRHNGYTESLRDIARGSLLVREQEYGPAGIPTKTVRGNGMVEEMIPDVRLRPSRIRVTTGRYNCGGPGGIGNGGEPGGDCGGELLWDSGNYAYDGAGNVARIGSDQYYYDPLSRLVGGIATARGSGETETFAHQYDAFGNMLLSQHQGVTALVPTAIRMQVDSQSNRLLSQTRSSALSYDTKVVEYDDSGNTVSDGDRAYVYDSLGRVEAVTAPDGALGEAYRYDPDGRRIYVKSREVETWYVRDESGAVLSEFRQPIGSTAGGVWDKDYVYLNGKNFALFKNDAPKPPVPVWATDVSLSTNGKAYVTVNWRAVNEPDVMGYSVTRAVRRELSESLTTYNINEYVGPVLQFEDSVDGPFDAITEIHYRVYAMDTAGNLSASSAVLVVRPMGSPPPVPLALRALVDQGRVALSWKIFGDDDLWGYRVDRGPSNSGPWTSLTGSAPTLLTEYLDLAVTNGVTYTYRVITVDTWGRTSAPAYVAATPRDTTPPSPPGQLIAYPTAAPDLIRVEWTPSAAPDVDKYEILHWQATQPQSTATITSAGVNERSRDIGVPNASTPYLFGVRAVDEAGNASTVATIASPVKARHAYSSRDVCVTASRLYSNHGTSSSDFCDTTAEDDDYPFVRVTWVLRSPNCMGALDSDSSLAGSLVRIYRRLASAGWAAPIADVDFATGTYDDATADPNAVYVYYVAPLVSVGGAIEEMEAGGATVVEGTTVPGVRSVLIQDGYQLFDTPNRFSRGAILYWSRSPASIVGYHVYRRCELDRGASLGFSLQSGTFACEYPWVLLNRVPVSDASRVFFDGSLGGLEGVYDFMVRAVRADGSEGPTLNAIELNGYEPIVTPTSTVQCSRDDSVGVLNADLTISLRAMSIELGRVNGLSRGTYSAALPVPQPTLTSAAIWNKPSQVGWVSRSARAARLTFEFLGASAPSDLAGFRVETAGAENGPWAAVNPNLVAWWEREYVVQGLGLERVGGGYSGHTECMWFRIIAVDGEGNESMPSSAGTLGACGGGTQTPDAPTNLTGAVEAGCSGVRLNWDAVLGATAYHVYRLPIPSSGLATFYETQEVVGNPLSSPPPTTFCETGQDVLNSSNPNTDCPIDDFATPCAVNAQEAFFVTAQGPSGGESPRSNLVFVDTFHNTSYIATSTTPLTPAASLPSAHADAEMGAAPTAQPESAGTESAPMVHLGQSADPPWRLYFLHTDHLGSVRMVTEPDGTASAFHDFLPFGTEIGTVTDVNTHWFAGHERDVVSGADYMLARYYASGSGRFLSTDTGADSDILTPQTWNAYAYVRNNPVKFNDPNGEFAQLATAATGVLIGGLAGGGWNLGVQLYKAGWDLGKVNWQDVGASAAGGALTGGMVGLTGGGSLLANATNAAAGAIIGGVVQRDLDSDPNTEALDHAAMAVDGVGAAAGVVGSEVGGKVVTVITGSAGTAARAESGRQFARTLPLVKKAVEKASGKAASGAAKSTTKKIEKKIDADKEKEEKNKQK